MRHIRTRLVLGVESVLDNVLHVSAVLGSVEHDSGRRCYTYRAPHLSVLDVAVKHEKGVGRGGRAVQRVDGTGVADVSMSTGSTK
jgi:hypothetical protein